MRTAFIAFKLLLILTILTGVLYPLFVTLVAGAIFPDQASGSMIEQNGKLIGSRLIAQRFESDKYFWSRPSAVDYNPLPSGGSNLSYTNRDLKVAVLARGRKVLQDSNAVSVSQVPVDLLFASGSGLDPHVSPEGALVQVARVARARGLTKGGTDRLEQLVTSHVEGRGLGFLGEPRVNVLLLNIALDSLTMGRE